MGSVKKKIHGFLVLFASFQGDFQGSSLTFRQFYGFKKLFVAYCSPTIIVLRTEYPSTLHKQKNNIMKYANVVMHHDGSFFTVFHTQHHSSVALFIWISTTSHHSIHKSGTIRITALKTQSTVIKQLCNKKTTDSLVRNIPIYNYHAASIHLRIWQTKTQNSIAKITHIISV